MYGHSILSPSFSSKRVDSASYFLLPFEILKKPWPFSFVTSLNNFPEERKSFCHFHVCISLEVHFTAFVVLECVMNAVSVCMAEK